MGTLGSTWVTPWAGPAGERRISAMPSRRGVAGRRRNTLRPYRWPHGARSSPAHGRAGHDHQEGVGT